MFHQHYTIVDTIKKKIGRKKSLLKICTLHTVSGHLHTNKFNTYNNNNKYNNTYTNTYMESSTMHKSLKAVVETSDKTNILTFMSLIQFPTRPDQDAI